MKASDGSLFTTIMLFAFIAMFGYDLILNGWGAENKPLALVWLAVVSVTLVYAIIDWGKKHPEINEIDND